MKAIDDMTDEEFRSHAYSIIGNELGAYGLARFIRLTVPGRGDYTRDRHQWLGEQTTDVEAGQQEHRAA